MADFFRGVRELLNRHATRFASFSLIGGGLFAAGLLFQAELTTRLHVPALVSYIVQTVLSVEVSYFLNRWLTWRTAQAPLWSSLARYNLQKAVTVSVNLVLYGVLLRLGVQYLLDNVLLTIVFTFVNYAGADKLVFLRGSEQAVDAVPVPVVAGSLETENR
jgi:putative flippase GtrA